MCSWVCSYENRVKLGKFEQKLTISGSFTHSKMVPRVYGWNENCLKAISFKFDLNSKCAKGFVHMKSN